MIDKMIDGIIFDVDGTIWDSTPVVEKAWNTALMERGYTERVTAEQLKGLFGLPMLDIIAAIIPYASQEEMESFLEVCSRYEFEFLENESGIVYEGLEEMLQALSKDFKLAVVSNCQAGYIELMYARTGFGQYFSGHLCPDDTGVLKADNIKLMAQQLGMENPVYVGDIGKDEIASREAGVKFIHASYGFGEAEAPDGIIEKPLDLIDVVKKI